MFLLLLITVLILLPAFYYLILYPRFLSPLRCIPGPPLGSILKGQFPTILAGEVGIPQREWVKTYGPTIRVVGPVGIERIIFTRPEALSKILSSDWIDYPKPDFARHILGYLLGYGLLTVTGSEHKAMRKAMNPAFALSNLVEQMSVYYDKIDVLIDILRHKIDSSNDSDGRVVLPMYEWTSRVTLDIICMTAFGYNSNSLRDPHDELTKAYRQLVNLQSGERAARFATVISIPGVPAFLQSKWAYDYRDWIAKIPGMDIIRTTLDNMHRIKFIARTILDEKLVNEGVSPDDRHTKKDIMSLLVKARHSESLDKNEKTKEDEEEGGYAMSDEMIMDQVLTFLGAGHETMASGLAWTLYLLAKSPEIQQSLRDEVSDLFNPALGDARPDYSTLKDLQVLDCVIMESLRLLPPAPMAVRKAGKSDYIDGVFIPKGTIISIPLRVVNTWKVVWGEDAEEFRPNRWLNLPQTYSSTYSFLSFLAGPHACLGKTMAIMEMKAVLGALIANFEFLLAYEGQMPKPIAAISMKPKDDMPLKIRRIR